MTIKASQTQKINRASFYLEMSLRYLFAFTLVISSFNYTDACEPIRIKHYVNDSSHIVTMYVTDVLITILDKTVPEFGPYEIDYLRQPLSSNRLKLEAERGVVLDVLFSGVWHGQFTNEKNMIQIDHPLFDGLLGLRSIIVPKSTSEKFSKIESLEDLRQYKVGQGANWTDINLLSAHQIPITTAQLFDGLFPMLEKGRSDYVMLSIIEAERSLRVRGDRFDDLMVNQDLNVFYPIPYNLYVNAQRPELAERLRRGLEIAEEDGSLREVFDRHFHSAYKPIEEKQRKLIFLKNPLVSDEENNRSLKELLKRFPNSFNLID